jgi:hypothetical protein
VSGAHLRPDASLAERHDRVRETDHVTPRSSSRSAKRAASAASPSITVRSGARPGRS